MIGNFFHRVVGRLGFNIVKRPDTRRFKKIYNRYRDFTMIRPYNYCDNLFLIDNHAPDIKGDVVECGVWRGGMIAGIAELLGASRHYFLFDSFEGLPPAQEIDGVKAIEYQENKTDDNYFDNCTAEIGLAKKAMAMTNAEYTITQGWFKDSLKNFAPPKIAVLRLDGDWYESTLDCLKYLYPHVVDNGIIIIDDYYVWDGCSRAVHDYLASISSPSRINRSESGTCFIIKNGQ